MSHALITTGLCSPPRVLVAGRCRSALPAGDGGLTDALAQLVQIERVDASATPAGLLRLMRAGAYAIRHAECEAIHLLDGRLAPAALMLRARFGVPVTATLSQRDVPSRRPSALMGLLGRLDHAFTSDGAAAAVLTRRVPQLPLSVTDRVASGVAAPSPRALASMVKLLRDITPGRLVIAVPWPDDPAQVRCLRDAVAPLLHGRPVVLLLGASRRRQARLMLGAIGMQTTYRLHSGPIDADTLAAAGRCADAFVLLASARRAPDIDSLLLSMIGSRAPVVAAAGVRNCVLEHERNALAADADDAMSLVSTLNQLLALPPVQRHYLGEEFAAYAMQRWTWGAPARVYAERFAALVGRPQIPMELRAAA